MAENLNHPDGTYGVAARPNQSKRDLRTRLNARRAQLDNDRQSWWPNWIDLVDHFRPYRGRFMMSGGQDTNKGWRRNFRIVDSTPLQTNNICAAGLLAGTASPSRPWFTYKFSDAKLMQEPEVKEWVAAVTETNREILAHSNFYNALFEALGEYGVVGTMALGREWPLNSDPNEADIPSFYSFTIGSYLIGNDAKRRVGTWFRDFQWTVEQVVEKYKVGENLEKDAAWVNISKTVRDAWENNKRDQMVWVRHAVEWNTEYRKGMLGWRGMRFRSTWYEVGGGDDDKTLADTKDPKNGDGRALRVGGFRDFPVFVARWYTNSEDAWGRGWAMDALGDARALQFQQKRKAQAIDKLIDPPVVADASLRNQYTGMLAGDVTFVAPDAGNSVGVKPIHEVKPDANLLLEDIRETQQRIRSVGYADIFAMFIQQEQSGQPITAAEVNAKQQEKLLMLGPVLEQMNYDLFNPLHEWLFAEGMRHGKYPPVPAAVGKATLRVTYVSMLAQAIQGLTSQAIKEFTAFVGEVLGMAQAMQASPAGDKFNADAAIEEMGKATGVPPSLVRSDADVAQIRQVRQKQQDAQAQQQQAAQAAQNLNTHADTAQTLSQTPLGGGGSALDRLAGAVGAAPVAG